nr:unnamed protein product [Digitaria exilis]
MCREGGEPPRRRSTLSTNSRCSFTGLSLPHPIRRPVADFQSTRVRTASGAKDVLEDAFRHHRFIALAVFPWMHSVEQQEAIRDSEANGDGPNGPRKTEDFDGRPTHFAGGCLSFDAFEDFRLRLPRDDRTGTIPHDFCG